MASEIKHNIYLIIQESLNNILKYAEAIDVTIRFTCRPDTLALVIEDDGTGFNTDDLDNCGMGLDIIQLRVQDCNLSLKIISQICKGTRIEVYSV